MLLIGSNEFGTIVYIAIYRGKKGLWKGSIQTSPNEIYILIHYLFIVTHHLSPHHLYPAVIWMAADPCECLV